MTTTLGEAQESELIRLNNVSLATPSQWTNSGSGFNVDVTDGTTTYVVRIVRIATYTAQPLPRAALIWWA